MSAAWNKGLQTGVKVGNVPTDRVGPIIAQLVAERWPKRQRPDGEEWGLSILAEKIDCSEDAIDNIIRGAQPGAEFDLVDQIFCALGRPDLWWGALKDIYGELILLERCENPDCEVRFPSHYGSGPKRRRFCSTACRKNAHMQLRGEARRRRKNGWGAMCRNGHKRTPETTRADGRCLICRRESWAAGQRARTVRLRAAA